MSGQANRLLLKRIFDTLLIIITSPIILPLLGLVSLLVMINIGFPILFSQKRPGLKNKPFMLRKFRTMSEDRGPTGALLPDSDRLGKFGIFLRKTSLDELPEVWNVLMGDMSIVGPRPLLMKYLTLYSDEQMKRHDVRPGITGLAQVNGRNSIDWGEKFKIDCYYVENFSFKMDIGIIFKTILVVLKSDGVSNNNHATMSEFKGNATKIVE